MSGKVSSINFCHQKFSRFDQKISLTNLASYQIQIDSVLNVHCPIFTVIAESQFLLILRSIAIFEVY